jgi:hypothetical protein
MLAVPAVLVLALSHSEEVAPLTPANNSVDISLLGDNMLLACY